MNTCGLGHQFAVRWPGGAVRRHTSHSRSSEVRRGELRAGLVHRTGHGDTGPDADHRLSAARSRGGGPRRRPHTPVRANRNLGLSWPVAHRACTVYVDESWMMPRPDRGTRHRRDAAREPVRKRNHHKAMALPEAAARVDCCHIVQPASAASPRRACPPVVNRHRGPRRHRIHHRHERAPQPPRRPRSPQRLRPPQPRVPAPTVTLRNQRAEPRRGRARSHAKTR